MIDLLIAEQLLYCCELSYISGLGNIIASESYGPSGISGGEQFFTADGSFSALTGRLGERRVIAFRGTMPENILDWLADAEADMVEWAQGQIHVGFHRAFVELMPQVAHVIADGMLVIGHSLGGAVSSLFAMYESTVHPLCCTFGSPKVGDGDFAAEYNRLVPQTWRFQNSGDPVPELPLPLPGFGYEHVGNLVLMGSEPVPLIGRHYLESYRSSLEALQ